MIIAVNARFLLKGKLEGIGWYSHEILKRLVQTHPEHEFHFFFDREYDEEFIYAKNTTAHILRPAARHPILWYWWFEHSIPTALKKINAQLFLSPDGYCSLNATCKQLLIVHDLAYLHYPKQIPFLVKNFYSYFVPRYLQKAEHIFAVSNATKQDIIHQFNISKNKISIAYNGCRKDFIPLNKDDIYQIRNQYTQGKAYFLFVGAMHPRKNVHHLIRAFEIFKQKTSSDFKLVLVGRQAWLTQEIELAYQESKFKDDIQFMPYLDSRQLALITAAAFCAVCPSYLEGFGVPALEALTSGVPLIVSDRFSLPEVGGPSSIKINPDDINSIADAMQQIIADNNIQEKIDVGLEHAKKFSWDESAAEIWKQISKMIIR